MKTLVESTQNFVKLYIFQGISQSLLSHFNEKPSNGNSCNKRLNIPSAECTPWRE